MSQEGVAVVEPPAVEAKPAPPRQKPDTKTKPKLQPPYAVILHNDSINGFDYVITVLKKVFHYGSATAFMMTLRAHLSGRSLVWSGSLEVAELKAEQIKSCGPDPRKRDRGGRPLKPSVEPLPG